MKLPSLEQVWRDSVRTLSRFPVVMACAAVGTAAAIALVNNELDPENSSLLRIILPAALGIPMLTAFALISETRMQSKAIGAGMQLIGVVLLAAYGLILPSTIEGAPLLHVFRFQMYMIAVLFLLTVSPYVGRLSLTGFWHFNKTLAFRLLTAAIFSHVLFLGLTLALAALDNLFGVEVPGRRYFQLWILVNGIFAIWFFLAGIPEDYESLERETDYPKILKAFAQYILLPVVVLYFMILYAYVGKIMIAWSWPQGWVSGLILGFSITGLVSLILLHPIRDRQENAWMKRAWRWFFVVLAPLTVVLWLAVWRRISEYGITEPRYIALAYAVWLAAILVYFLFSRVKNIKIIPWSLCVFALVISFGPWGAFKVSEASQIGRLKALLVSNSILVGGTVQKAPGTVSADDRREISAIIGYLHLVHGYNGIQPWFKESLTQDTGTAPRFMDPVLVTPMLGIIYDPMAQSSWGDHLSLAVDPEEAMSVSGYDYLLSSQFVTTGSGKWAFPESGVAYRVDSTLNTLTFLTLAGEVAKDSLQISLRALVDGILTEGSNEDLNKLSRSALSASAEKPGLRVKVYFEHVQLSGRKEGLQLLSYKAEILYSIGNSWTDSELRDHGSSFVHGLLHPPHRKCPLTANQIHGISTWDTVGRKNIATFRCFKQQ